MIISDIEYRRMVKQAEWEKVQFLKDHPELEKLQEELDLNLSIIGENPVARLQYLMSKITNNAKLMVKELEILEAVNKNYQKFLKGAAEALLGPPEEGMNEEPVTTVTVQDQIQELIEKWKKFT